MYDAADEDDKLLETYCVFCGTMIGRVESPIGSAGFHCPRCKKDYIVRLKEEVVTFRTAKRGKRPSPVTA